MKKLLGIVFLGLLLSETVSAFDITQKEFVPGGFYQGELVENSKGIPMYYSPRDKKFLTCEEFRDKDLQIDKKFNSRFSGGRPICDKEEMTLTNNNGETYKAIFDYKSGKFIKKISLMSRIKKSEYTPLVLLVLALIGIGVLIYRFKQNIKKILKPKVNFYKKNKVKMYGTLSIIYLCIMLWLNWLGHQSAFFVYKMTYTWFLGWGVAPIVALWSIYLIWKKK